MNLFPQVDHSAMSIADITHRLRHSRGFAHKRDISDVVTAFGKHLPGGVDDMAQSVAVGDDCAAIPDPSGDGHLLLAIEGMIESFVEHMPWFAGYCGVMVNVSDIYAMGGRPIAVVDALWSHGNGSATEIVKGMADASSRYGVPVVGGHTNNRADRPQLAVAILGRAKKLISSFAARPGDELLMAIDLRGEWQHPYPYWNASTSAPASRLRADLELLPEIAEAGLCEAGKDISMAGAIGTALMLLECSGHGATIDLDAIPRPPEVASDAQLLTWLSAFPSYGFVLSVKPENREAVMAKFWKRGIACAAVGEVHAGPQVLLRRGGQHAELWNLAEQPFIRAKPKSEAAHA
jgi:AIR synthase-related protein